LESWIIMSLHNLAQNMAAHGRNGDSMLMHVTPDEVQGLQSLAMANGGSLSINPHTGLPEANFFSQAWKAIKPFAPMIAGLALGPAGFGLMGAGAAGLTVGGASALATGSLQKGLMAGLGAYGGASLGAGLTEAGADAAAKGAATKSFAGSPASSISGLGKVGTDIVTAPQAEQLLGASQNAAAAGSAARDAYMAQGSLAKLGGGLSELAANPTNTFASLGNGSATMGGLKTAAVLAPPILESMAPGPYKGPEQTPGMIRPAVLTRTQIPESESPRIGSAERRHFNDVWTYPPPYKAGTTPSGATGGVVAFNEGGLGSLGGYSDGGRLLRGPGDGVSDSIPATIGDRQPARLADGEFVVPARIVSEIGNGSTEAGARKLYAMMDRVQKARKKTVGKNRVAANTRAEKYLPA
jgi:hypothetical protein